MYTTVHEGIYLFKNGVDPYSGGVFYQVRSTSTDSLNYHYSCLLELLVSSQSPLYLSVFSTFLPLNRLSSPVVWTLVDGVGAYALVQTWRARSGLGKSKRDVLLAALYVLNLGPGVEGLTKLFSVSYLFNPYLFLPSLALSTSSISNMLHLLTIMFAARGQLNIQFRAFLFVAHTIYRPGMTSPALFSLAALVHVSLSSVLLVFPVILLLLGKPKSALVNPTSIPVDFRKGRAIGLEFLAHFFVLTLTSILVSGGFQWMWQTWFVEWDFCLLPIVQPTHF